MKLHTGTFPGRRGPIGACARAAATALLAAACLLPRARAEAPAPGTPQRPVLVGINRDYPPYESVSPRGEAEGYDVELVQAVARVMGLEIRVLPGPWDQVREGLETGRIDLAAGMLKSPDRARFADFSAPHMVVHYSIFVRRDAGAVRSLEDLRGRRVIVERGSQMHEHLVQLGFGSSILPVGSEPEALRLLASGQGEAALAPLLEGILLIRSAGLSNLQPVGAPIASRELCFAVAKGRGDLCAKLDTGLAILHRTGEYGQIYRRWFGHLESRPISPAQIARTSLWIVLPLLGATLAVLLWNGALRRRVHRATVELRRANQSLRESEGLLKAVIDSIPLMLFVKDPKDGFRFTVWNRKAEELLGFRRAEVLGRTDFDILPAAQAEQFRRGDQAVLDSGRLFDFPEETVLSAARGPVLLHTMKVPVHDEEGRPRLLLGISEDLTFFRRIESELQHSRASLAEAQRIARMGSWEMDAEGGEGSWSDEMYRILGHEPGDCPPSVGTLLEHSHPRDLERLKGLFHRAAETGSPGTLDHTVVLPGGAERHLMSHVEARREQAGGSARLVGTSQDITERRNAEEALRQTQRLESLGVLAGGIAHDFNNLLTAIMGNLNLAQALAGEEHPVLPYLKKIETTVVRASNLSRQMLAYSGRGTILIKPLDLNRLIREMAHLLEVSISKKAVMSLALDPFIPWIDADESQIQQIVMNLVTNASEAIGDREGMITLRTGMQILEEEALAAQFQGQELRPGTYVAFEVRDTGCGMEPELLARIFEPFFTTKFSGRGLGLAALMGILKSHRGGIRIESEAGQGSAFRLYFPASAEHPAPSPEPVEERAEPSSGTLLLAEDEPIVRLSTVEMLRSLGYRVLETPDGVEAVECFREHGDEIAAVILDLTMPRMDGREALREILRLRPDAKVILCSGFHEQEALQGTEARSIAGFLSKPYRMRELQAMLEKVLRGG